ncbi:MAG: molybdenum ABC transporter ATP-binding protein [Gammaproteobacteria bacterium]|nr:molybdenum ABC transporter ATP-binding protein [Gammaproteobacteria bacterium]
MRLEHPTLLSVDVSARYSGFELRLRQKISLHGITGIFGPSGSGKSTLLRIIAGLERAGEGRVEFENRPWLDSTQGIFVPPYRRPVGFVFQDVRLFDHMNVEGNLRYAAQRARNSDVDYDEVVGIFDLGEHLSRQPQSLSGGEKQRVAIARTLLTHPRLLLLDEPMAALDAGRKNEILPYLEALPSRFDIPAIYVTHAVDEIARLADQVLVIRDGESGGLIRPVELLDKVDVVGGAAEAATIIEAQVVDQDPDLHLTRLQYREQLLVVPELGRRRAGDSARLYIRAGDVALATQKPQGSSFRNILEGTVQAIEPQPAGAFATVLVDIAGTSLRANLTRHAVLELELAPGTRVFALIKTASFDR